MRSRTFIILLAIVAFAYGLFVVTAQEPDDDVRGAFLSTRPKTTNQSTTRRRRPPRNTNVSVTAAMNVNAGVSQTANANTAKFANQNSLVAKSPAQAIGLGYTLFMRDSNGRNV